MFSKNLRSSNISDCDSRNIPEIDRFGEEIVDPIYDYINGINVYVAELSIRRKFLNM